MATPSKGLDRRAERTRTLIRQAVIEIAREKSLSAISIQEITERANISRGTFYAHFADKYALIEAILREDFQRTIRAVPLESGWNKTTLQMLIQTVLDYFKTVYQRHHRERDIAPLIEKIIHEELYTLIFTGLKLNTSAPMLPEMLAQIISWAIFGAALHWSQESAPLSAEQTAQQILSVILDGVADQVTDISET